MKNPWKTVKKNVLYTNKYGLTLRDDDVINPKGKPGKYMVLESKGYVGIVALTENKEILLVRQWRYPIEKDNLEIVAGYLNPDESGEKALPSAKRELREEIGGESQNWKFMGIMQEGASYQNKKGYLFLAQDVKMELKNELEETEDIKLEKIPLAKAVKMVENNEIQDEKTIIGILLTNQLLVPKK